MNNRHGVQHLKTPDDLLNQCRSGPRGDDQSRSAVRSKAWIVDDDLWKLIEPVLPPWPDKAPRPRPLPDRLCLQGILFVLHTGIEGEDLPQELGFGSRMTCWRRLERWTESGVFDQVHQILLAKLNAANRIDWSRAVGLACVLICWRRLINWTRQEIVSGASRQPRPVHLPPSVYQS